MARASDKELVKQCLQGDNRAFEELVDKYQLTMFRTSLSVVKDTESAKDVTQNGFIKAWEKLESYNPKFKFYSWLYRIIINEALNKVRDTKNRESIPPDQTNGETPFQEITRKEENKQLHQAIEDLDSMFSSVIYLRHFEELSYKEISEILGIDEKKVKSRLYSARMKLRESLFIDR